MDALRSGGSRLSAAAAAAGPDAAVPSCPGWVVRDLVRHQGGIHRWAASIVGTPRTEEWRGHLDEVVGTLPAGAHLIGWVCVRLDALVQIPSASHSGLSCPDVLAAAS